MFTLMKQMILDMSLNSLPSYKIYDDIREHTAVNVGGPNGGTFTTLISPVNYDFRDGDEVVYTSSTPISGLVSGASYFVTVGDGSPNFAKNEMRVFASRALLGNNSNAIDLGPYVQGVHTFTLRRHEDRVLSPKQVFRKFSLKTSLSDVKSEKRPLGSIGILVDGVEISSPESRDKIYYGPIDEFEVLNGGKDYDVVNPPQITIGNPVGTANTTALVEAVVVGDVKNVLVDPQDFDIESIEGITLTGGNGSGCLLEPVLGDRFRELEFDSRARALGGGVDIDFETINFTQTTQSF